MTHGVCSSVPGSVHIIYLLSAARQSVSSLARCCQGLFRLEWTGEKTLENLDHATSKNLLQNKSQSKEAEASEGPHLDILKNMKMKLYSDLPEKQKVLTESDS